MSDDVPMISTPSVDEGAEDDLPIRTGPDPFLHGHL